MLKFIKHHMETIDGVAIYPIISLSIFFVFFLVLSIWVLKLRKPFIEDISQLPLDQKKTE